MDDQAQVKIDRAAQRVEVDSSASREALGAAIVSGPAPEVHRFRFTGFERPDKFAVEALPVGRQVSQFDAGLVASTPLAAVLSTGRDNPVDQVHVGESHMRITLLAESTQGYRNLMKVSSHAYLDGFYYKPRTDWELLELHSEGLIATSGCLGGIVAQRILELRDEGVSMNQMAVLYRSHFHALELQLELTRRNIPFSITSGIRFFEQAHIKDVTSYLRLV